MKTIHKSATLRTSSTAAALALLSIPLWTRPQTDPSDPHARFSGSFHFTGGDRERQGIDVAIDHVVSNMSFVTRGIARSRLHDKCPAFTAVSFQCAPGTITVSFAGPPLTYHTRDDGSSAPGQGVGGDAITVTQRFDHGNLLQILAGDNGSRRNYFMLSNDGSGLTLDSTISSSRLPSSVHFQLSYHR